MVWSSAHIERGRRRHMLSGLLTIHLDQLRHANYTVPSSPPNSKPNLHTPTPAQTYASNPTALFPLPPIPHNSLSTICRSAITHPNWVARSLVNRSIARSDKSTPSGLLSMPRKWILRPSNSSE